MKKKSDNSIRMGELAKNYSMNCDESMGLEDHCEDALKAGFVARDAEIEKLKDIARRLLKVSSHRFDCNLMKTYITECSCGFNSAREDLALALKNDK